MTKLRTSKQKKNGTPNSSKKRTLEELVEYERYAVQGIIELLPKWYEERGMGGLIWSLARLLKECDNAACAAQGSDDKHQSKQRWAVAEHIRLETMLNREEIASALEFLAKMDEEVEAEATV